MARRSAFTVAQEGWGRLKEAKGFHAQTGGWVDHRDTDALIVSLWESQKHYDKFMKKLHGEITAENKQEETYKEIEVHVLDLQIPFPSKAPTIKDAILDCGIVRFADCNVRSGRVDNFKKNQEEIWIPGMSACEGMLGGAYAASFEDPLHHFVLTFWDTVQSHQLYVRQAFTELAQRAQVSSDAHEVTGGTVQVSPGWRVGR